MKENSIANRYAKAMIGSLKNDKEYNMVRSQLQDFQHLLEVNPEFRAGMETSLFSKQQKIELFESIHAKVKFSAQAEKFILEIIDANRIPVMDAILEVMERLWYEKSGIEKFTLYSAVKLNANLEKRLIKNLEETLKKKIVLEKEIDPSLIAGIKLKKGSIYYDFSIDGNLKKLYEILTEGSEMDSIIQEN